MFGKLKRGSTKILGGRKNNKKLAVDQGDILSVYGEILPDEQLQNKVVLYFVSSRKMEAVPDGPAEVTPEQKNTVAKMFADGQIGSKQVAEFLLQVLSPLEDLTTNLSGIFQQIAKNPKEKQILAVATGHDMRNWQNVNEEDLRNLLGKPVAGQVDYRTPVGFAVFRKKFLDGIRSQANDEQMASYIEAMNDLELHMYGRRFEYYRQMLIMGGGASDEMRQEVKPVVDEFVEDISLQEIIDEERGSKSVATKPLQQANVGVIPSSAGSTAIKVAGATTVTPERSNEVLNRAIISGDPWVQDGAEYRLEIANLTNGGLMPIYEIAYDGATVLLSEPFQLSDGRGAMLGYVLRDDGAKVRGYYLNPKTGLWHFAPDIIRGARGEGMAQITEGYGMASTMLPVVLQNTMSGIVKAGGFREITAVNPDFLFAGTAAAYNTQQEYRDALAKGAMKSDFYREVDANPVNESWKPNGKAKNMPQLISVSATMAPNFQKLVVRFATYSILAGQVNVDVFLSNDGQFLWTFCSDDWGRVWIGNIEVISPMTSTGCRRDWMAAGDMVTPLYEYSTQAGNYGDPSDTRKGLVGMWTQYLSRIPVIQEYVNWRTQNK